MHCYFRSLKKKLLEVATYYQGPDVDLFETTMVCFTIVSLPKWNIFNSFSSFVSVVFSYFILFKSRFQVSVLKMEHLLGFTFAYRS